VALAGWNNYYCYATATVSPHVQTLLIVGTATHWITKCAWINTL